MNTVHGMGMHHIRFVYVLVAIGVIALAGCGTPPAAAPTSYTSYNSKAGTFACEYPEGWELKDGGKRGPEWATFASGSAEIRFNADVTGSLIAGDQVPDPDTPPTLEPVHILHVDDVERVTGLYSGYSEVAGPNVHDCKLGPARLSEFTASTTFGGGLHGYRATVLGHNKRVIAFCVCPESNWATLKPAFDHVLSTVQRGSPQ